MIQEIELPIRSRCFYRPKAFQQEVARNVGVQPEEVQHIEVLRKSIDGRSRFPVYRVLMRVYTTPDTYQKPFKNLKLPAA